MSSVALSIAWFSCALQRQYIVVVGYTVQGVPTSFRWEVLVKISNLRKIRILKFFVKNIRQIEVRSALFS